MPHNNHSSERTQNGGQDFPTSNTMHRKLCAVRLEVELVEQGNKYYFEGTSQESYAKIIPKRPFLLPSNYNIMTNVTNDSKEKKSSS
jgi:hypothetical protein